MTRPLRFLPGWGMRASVFDALINELDATTTPSPDKGRAGKGFGHGTIRPPHGTLKDWAQHIASTLPPDTLLCGWSLGGMLALEIARQTPLAALVLIGTTPRFTQASDWPHAVSLEDFNAFENLYHRDPAALLHQFIQLQCMGDANPKSLARTLTPHLADHTHLGPGLNILRHTDLRDITLNTRTLIIQSAQDRLCPLAAGQALAKQTGAHLHVIDKAGHAPHVSHPGDVAHAIKQFLQ